MPITTLSSREFNQDTGGAKKAALNGPVFITDRGKPSFVLMTAEEYNRMSAGRPNIVELLSAPSGVDVQFEPQKLTFDPRLPDLS